jgi:chromosomal replication initiation ATPase DnaA
VCEETDLSPQNKIAIQLRLDLERQTSYAREDFIVADCNRAAVAAIDSWPAWPGGKLAIVGPSGSGKTHLARAWAAKTAAATAEIMPGAEPANAMLVDDADRFPEETLFHLVNRADAGSSLLITGRTPPSTWVARLPDLRSRLNALTVATIDTPDDAVLLGVMEKLFVDRNIRPKPGVAEYAVRRIERSVPAVQDLVLRIDEWAGAEKREITLGLVRRILQIDDGVFDPLA